MKGNVNNLYPHSSFIPNTYLTLKVKPCSTSTTTTFDFDSDDLLVRPFCFITHIQTLRSVGSLSSVLSVVIQLDPYLGSSLVTSSEYLLP